MNKLTLVPMADLRHGIGEAIDTLQQLLADDALLAEIVNVAELMVQAFQNGNRVLFAGNGASAADAQHFASDFVSRFAFDRPGLPSLSLSTDTSMLTAIGNDYGYEKLFQRQLEAQARPGDVFVGITTSGRSPNILAAFDACPKLGVTAVALSGARAELDGRVAHVLRAPSVNTPRIQECHIVIGHMLIGQVEKTIFGQLSRV